MTYKIHSSVFVFAILLLYSCNTANKWKPDVSHIKADVKFIRLEKELFEVDTLHYQESIGKVIDRHKEIMEFFVSRLHKYGRWDDPNTLIRFKKAYLQNRYMKDSLYPDVEKAFPEPVIHDLETQFSDAFRHIKYYYPADSLPKVYTIINPFGFQSYTYGKDLLISLEFFLGEKYRYYPSLEMPEYKIRTFRKEYILPTSLKTLFQDKYDEDRNTDQTLLSKMVYLGKRLFYLDAMKPDMADSLKIEYSKKQLDWCKSYEHDIWDHLVTKNLLYNTTQDKVDRYVSEGPFTNDEDVPQESAPRLGEWVGWQIVKKYMDNNPKVTIQELFNEKDYRKILTLSKYKP
jgi:hypothetical protein